MVLTVLVVTCTGGDKNRVDGYKEEMRRRWHLAFVDELENHILQSQADSYQSLGKSMI